ncbi:unnamed protein product [Brachionus calyciflorus]|uniref:CCHC-type domain-containing protein n=1 Tax=Brachionus calyciflorus TaxID=104777 RepID=A0A813T209_9BILA|nr:unnamed protein product [Brachionus calyciflorus]
MQEQEFKKLLPIVADAKSPENEIDEKDELIFLRADRSQLKFQLTQKDDLIKNLTEQLKNKKTVQFSENESVSLKNEEREESDKNDNEKSDVKIQKKKMMITNLIKKHSHSKRNYSLSNPIRSIQNSVSPINYLRNSKFMKKYRPNEKNYTKFYKNDRKNKGLVEKNDKFEKKKNFFQNAKKEYEHFKQSKDKSSDSNEVICRRCKKKGHYANKCYANLNKVNSLKISKNEEEKVYVVHLEERGPKNICSVKGLVDKKPLKIDLDCGATDSTIDIFQTDVELSKDYYWDMSYLEMVPASDLNAIEKLKFNSLTKEAKGLFARKINELGICSVSKHKIRLINDDIAPIYTPPYRISQNERNFLKDDFDKMLKANIIKPDIHGPL